MTFLGNPMHHWLVFVMLFFIVREILSEGEF